MLSIECGSKRLELSFKNTVPLQLIFHYHGFEDAYLPIVSGAFRRFLV